MDARWRRAVLLRPWGIEEVNEDTKKSLTIGAILFVIGAASPFLPDDPLAPAIPAVIFSVTFAFMVGNYHIFLPAQVALEAVSHSANEGMVICNREGQSEQINCSGSHGFGSCIEAFPCR